MKCVSRVGNEHTAIAFIRCAQKLHPEKKAQMAILGEEKVILKQWLNAGNCCVIPLEVFCFCFFLILPLCPASKQAAIYTSTVL